MKILNTILFGCLIFLFWGCNIGEVIYTDGSGNIVKESRDGSGFKVVSLNSSGNVYITQGDKESIEVETDDNLMKFITIRVVDGVLELDVEQNICPKKLNYFITMKEVKGFKINGSGNMYGQSAFKSDDFFLKITGSGDMAFNEIESIKMGVLINGSGDLKVTGKAEKCSIEINGSGDIFGEGLTVDYVSALVNGSGDVRIGVEKSLEAQINGSGDITYSGEPSDKNIHINGSGDVRKMKEK